ncbi:MAG TPA: PQQ-dependent sugar dehydrogenase [Candidatus Dormibacteraeota bacterium]|nr:PQQ-dependent sugar dehydrogenase [Candidatus Dormibacteraeota bacterium]
MVAFAPVLRRILAVSLAVVTLVACSTAARQQGTGLRPSKSPPITQPGLSPTPSTLKPAGPLQFNQQSVAQELVAPWAIDFAKDGSAWLTERPGRVRVIRNGRLLTDPAVTISVATANGCEDGLLGIAVGEPYAYVYYTYSGSGGNTNRVSRFSISGDKLVSEQVLVDGIPGGTCYHFGGRLKLGPDGSLYFTTGEGFVASRAADPNSLSGKVMRVHVDGSGREVVAWGFRNPQGLAFDSMGRLYVSNNGPTGDLGLCCNDEVDLVQRGGFYGWPEWAASTRTSYPQGSLPAARIPPVAESGRSTAWAPSGMTFYAPSRDEMPTLLLAELKGEALRRLVIDPADPAKVTSQEIVLQGQGRLRDAVAGPDGCLYLLTSNRDSRGTPRPGDDQVLKLCPR